MKTGEKAIDSYGNKGNKEVPHTYLMCCRFGYDTCHTSHILVTRLPAITSRFCHILWQFLSQYGFTLKEAEVEVDMRLPSSVVHELAVSLGASLS